MGRLSSDHENRSVIQAAISVAIVLGLIFFEQQWALMDHFSRSTLCFTVGLFGVDCSWSEGYLNIGSVQFTWSDACSGINGLILYWVLILWANQLVLTRRQGVIGILASLPLALIANLLRVGFLLGYRTAFYPEVESISLHYLVGFLCLLPGVLLVGRMGLLPIHFRWHDMVYLSTVFSQLLAIGETPGMALLICATLAVLYDNETTAKAKPAPVLTYVVWIFAGLFILVSRMESLWLPWLLTFPAYWDISWRTAPIKLTVLAGTASVVVIQSFLQPLVILGLAAWVWDRFGRKTSPSDAPIEIVRSSAATWLTPLVMLPFFAPLTHQPPALHQASFKGAFTRPFSENSQEIKLMGQGADLRVFLFQPDGGGRHHALKTCMGFRGVTLESSADFPRVYTANETYYAEAFLVGSQLLDNYHQYLFKTVAPFTSVGLHLVVTAPTEAMPEEFFDQTSQSIFERLRDGYQPEL